MIKSLLKKFLSRKNIQLIKDVWLSIKLLVYRFFSFHPRLSAIYYLLFNNQFNRECQKVLLGKISYYKYNDDCAEQTSSALLRRNIHRIEKGLIMRPRRKIFASNYIGETVDIFEKMLNSKLFCKDEKKWAYDVLQKYFESVDNDNFIGVAREHFNTITANKTHRLPEQSLHQYIPYLDSDRETSHITPQELTSLYKQRRSTRWFLDKRVEDEKLNTAINMASLAPSACNRQPFKFHVMNDNATASEVASYAGGTGGFAQNIPCLIAVVGDLSLYPGEKDRHLIYIDSSLASMQLMLAFETLGLRSCPINWPDIEARERKIEKRLSLQASERVIMLIAVGYADENGGIPHSIKKTSDTLRCDVQPID